MERNTDRRGKDSKENKYIRWQKRKERIGIKSCIKRNVTMI